jgi:release factor glutamine methyltransferase
MNRGLALLDRHQADDHQAGQFTLLGQTWDLLDGVFSPAYTPVTELFTSWLPYPARGRFLEMGCGAGVTAVAAVQSGCAHATALDISSAAVLNTRRNAVRHGVADRVDVRRSDLFQALDGQERFDLIYWNSNFVDAPAGFVNETELHHAFFDPGYRAHRQFLREAPRYLAPGGRLFIGFSSIGNTGRLNAEAETAGLQSRMFRRETRQLSIPLEFQLLEFQPAGGAAWADLAQGGQR